MHKFLLACVLWFVNYPLYAIVVYRCESVLGKTTYQDFPCLGTQDKQKKMPFRTKFSEPHYQSKTQKKQKKKEALKLKAQRAKIIKKQKKLKKEGKIAAKKQQQQMKRQKRMKKHCQKIDQNIETIQNRLRAGYTARQGVSLQRKLKELQVNKNDRCRNEV